MLIHFTINTVKQACIYFEERKVNTMKTTEFEEWILRSSRREEYFEVLNSICGILEELNINEMQLVKIRTDFQMLEQIWLSVAERNIIEFFL